MSKLPKNLPDLLRKAGLQVTEIGDWYNNGRPPSTGSFTPVGVLNHHTGAFDRDGDLADDVNYARWMFYQGRSTLPAPLCHLSLSAEGRVFLGAAGRANHAGTAKASGSVASGDGNTLYVGIEWMLSGTQPIPPKMYKAGATLNAVLLDVLGSSVQAVSCHYQTSVTGKWDIGDPNGVAFNGAKVLDVPEFRRAVQKEKTRLNKPAAPATRKITIPLMHASMQTQDTSSQQAKDADDLFRLAQTRKQWWVTGTEANNKTEAAIYRAAAEKYGFDFYRGSDVWIALNRKRFPNKVKAKWYKVFDGEAGRYTDKGVLRVTATNPDIGEVTILASHYFTVRQGSGKNLRLANLIGDLARQYGNGKSKVFYGGDQNLDDRVRDTFYGSPLTTLQDELKQYEGTHGGKRAIDVLATFDKDGTVKAKSVDVLVGFEQFADHDVVVGEVVVTAEKAA